MSLPKDSGRFWVFKPGLWGFVVVISLCFPASVPAQQSETGLPPGQSASQQIGPSPALKELLAGGFELRKKRQVKESRDQFERALSLAREEKNRWAEAEAHRGLGLLLLDAAQYPAARLEFEEAVSTFLSLNSARNVAQVHLHMGALAGFVGNRAEALALNEKALAEYESLGDSKGQLLALENLALTEGIPPKEKSDYLQKGLDLARKVGDRQVEGHLLHVWGDLFFTAGDYAGALEKLQEAAACFEDANDKWDLARVLTSLGRLHRAHGSYEEAIRNYEHALSIQKETGDKLGVIQSLNAAAISYGHLGKEKNPSSVTSRRCLSRGKPALRGRLPS